MRKHLPFGKYLLLDRIAVGGMAEVFAAKTFGVEGFERLLAIKRILPTMVEDDEFITMFIDEARIAAMLSHANLVQIYELGKHDDTYYIAMEYVSGRDVRLITDKFRKKGKTVPLPMAVFIMARMCEGLDYAHHKKDAHGDDLNIIHRDISPQNVLVSYEGDVKIIDFGIAKAAGRLQKTQAGILKGKFGYMSPEQVRGMAIDHRSDLYSCGVMLYEMLTGEKLFSGESDFSTLEKVRAGEVRAPSELNPEIPPALERIVLKALAKERDERYQWCGELHDDLMRFLYQGDEVYSAKSLAAFMKEAFGTELVKEQERQRRWQAQKPEETSDFDLSASTPPVPAPDEVLAAASELNGGGGAVTSNGKVRIGPPSAFMTAELRLQDRTSIFEPFESDNRPSQTAPARPSDKSLLVTEAVSLAELGLPEAEVVQGAPTRIRSPDVPFDLQARRQGSAPPRRQREDDEADGGGIGGAATRVRPAPTRQPAPEPAPPDRPPLPTQARRGFSPAMKALLAVLALVIVATAAVGVRRGGIERAWHAFTGPASGALLLGVTPPDGARVTVDGRLQPGALPLNPRLPYGTHHVTVSEAGFQTFDKEVRVASKEVKLDVQLVPIPPPAPPPEAPVATADGEASASDQGAAAAPPKQTHEAERASPAMARQTAHSKVASDSRALARERSRERAQREAENAPPPAAPGERQETSAPAAPGGLNVFTIPPGAMLAVDDRPMGRTPQKLTNLPGGKSVELKLVLQGYRPLTVAQEVPAGSVETLRLKLPPNAPPQSAPPSSDSAPPGATGGHGTAKLIAMCLPTAQIIIDGRPTGRWTPVPKGNPIEVAAGRHTVLCQTKSGARSTPQELVMDAGQTVPYRARVQ